MWPTLLHLAIDDKAHRHTWSACYPCPVQAGSVPPGRHPLQHRAPNNFRSGSVRGFGRGLLAFPARSLATFRFQNLLLGLSLPPLVAHAVRAQRLAMVCKLPLLDSGPNRAPWVRNQAPTRFPRAETSFRRLSSLSHWLACHLTVPVALCELHSLAFDSLGRVNSTACRVCTLPLSRFGRVSAPWLPYQDSALLEASSCLSLLYVRLGCGVTFCGFSPLSLTSLSPCGSQTICRLSDTTFFLLWSMSSDRVLGMHATPIPLGGIEPPGRHHPAPGSRYCAHFW
jgi:hypothetical protein